MAGLEDGQGQEQAEEANRAKQNMRLCCDLPTETKLLGRLSRFAFVKEISIMGLTVLFENLPCALPLAALNRHLSKVL